MIHDTTPFLHFREYDNLKGSLRSSNEMCEKLKKEVFASNNKVTLNHTCSEHKPHNIDYCK